MTDKTETLDMTAEGKKIAEMTAIIIGLVMAAGGGEAGMNKAIDMASDVVGRHLVDLRAKLRDEMLAEIHAADRQLDAALATA